MPFVNREIVREFIEGKKVIILGGSPHASDVTAEDLSEYDVIVRVNNYIHYNEYTRTDLYYSYFGGSIIKTYDDLLIDGVKLILCKCPMAAFTDHTGGRHKEGYSFDGRMFYGKVKRYNKIDTYMPTLEEFKKNYSLIDRVPTTGMCCILDILKYNPDVLYVEGFDFFKSKIHHGRAWKEGDGNHDLEAERKLMLKLHNDNDNLLVSQSIWENICC